MPRVTLNEVFARNAVLPSGKRQIVYWSDATPGFGLLVGAASKAWVAQRDLPGGKTRRVVLGKYPELSLTQAKKAATSKLAAIIEGVDPAAERRARVAAQQAKEHETYTLRQALKEHIANMKAKGCSQRSIDHIEDEVTRLLSDWMDKPLASIRRKDCIERHRELSRAKPIAANRTIRSFRACWNSARRLFEDLPPHPVFVVFNKQTRKRAPIPWEQLAAWWAGVEALDNSVRRDLNILVLLTGLRSEDARTIKWDHVDFDKGTLHRPKPKGGEDRAFTIPLCAHLLAVLAKRKLNNRIRFNNDRGWVFPTFDTAGNVVHVRDARQTAYVEGEDEKLHKVTTAPTLHRLRDTFATACLEAGVGLTETKVLMNHTLPGGDVTQGYQRPSLEHLRACVEKVAAFLLGKAGQNAQEVAGEKRSA